MRAGLAIAGGQRPTFSAGRSCFTMTARDGSRLGAGSFFWHVIELIVVSEKSDQLDGGDGIKHGRVPSA
jgi:hypothetical protein